MELELAAKDLALVSEEIKDLTELVDKEQVLMVTVKVSEDEADLVKWVETAWEVTMKELMLIKTESPPTTEVI